MKRERRQREDEAVAAGEIFGDDDSLPAWRESVFKIRRLGRRTAGSGSQMGYTGNNHHTKMWDCLLWRPLQLHRFVSRSFFFFRHNSSLSISTCPSTVWVRSEPSSQAISSTAAQRSDAHTHKHKHWAELQKANLDITIYQHNNHSSRSSPSVQKGRFFNRSVPASYCQSRTTLTLKTMRIDTVQCVFAPSEQTPNWKKVHWLMRRKCKHFLNLWKKREFLKMLLNFVKSIYFALLVSVQM